MTAASSGGAGDLIYSVPILRALGVTRVYVKENKYPNVIHEDGTYFRGSLYESIKPLMEEIGFEILPTSGAYPIGTFEPGLEFDYNLDDFRNESNRGKNHIIISYLNHFKLSIEGWSDPWLIPKWEKKPDQSPFALIHLTPRWRERSLVNWKRVLERIDLPVFFIGFKEEYNDFVKRYGNITYIRTDNLLEMAILISQADKVYCNQSVSLALCQAMGKEYWLEKKPKKTNTIMGTPNEHIL